MPSLIGVSFLDDTAAIARMAMLDMSHDIMFGRLEASMIVNGSFSPYSTWDAGILLFRVVR